MIRANDILLDHTDNLVFKNGDFVVGDSLTQEVGIILRLQQGDLKSDPLLGPNLIQLEKGSDTENEFKDRVKIHLQRDNKQYSEIQKRLSVHFKKQ